MEKKATKQTKLAAGLKVLDQPPTENQVILVRNTYAGGIEIHSQVKDDPDVSLQILGEALVPATWSTNTNLRDYIARGWLDVEWVDRFYQPKKMPDLLFAPAEIMPDNPLERNLALQIATSADNMSLDLVNVTVYQPETTEIDVAYMHQSFAKILKLAGWIDEQMRDRPKIRSAIKAAIRRINDL